MEKKLKSEKYLWGNFDTDKMIEWVPKNVFVEDLEIEQVSMMCDCEKSPSKIGVFYFVWDMENDENTDDEINDDEIKQVSVFYCYKCEGWAIDNDS